MSEVVAIPDHNAGLFYQLLFLRNFELPRVLNQSSKVSEECAGLVTATGDGRDVCLLTKMLSPCQTVPGGCHKALWPARRWALPSRAPRKGDCPRAPDHANFCLYSEPDFWT